MGVSGNSNPRGFDFVLLFEDCGRLSALRFIAGLGTGGTTINLFKAVAFFKGNEPRGYGLLKRKEREVLLEPESEC